MGFLANFAPKSATRAGEPRPGGNADRRRPHVVGVCRAKGRLSSYGRIESHLSWVAGPRESYQLVLPPGRV